MRRVETDASDGEKMAKLAHSADVLYNCVNPAYHRWEEDWPPIANALLGATKRSAKAVCGRGCGMRRYILIERFY